MTYILYTKAGAQLSIISHSTSYVKTAHHQKEQRYQELAIMWSEGNSCRTLRVRNVDQGNHYGKYTEGPQNTKIKIIGISITTFGHPVKTEIIMLSMSVLLFILCNKTWNQSIHSQINGKRNMAYFSGGLFSLKEPNGANMQ